MNRKSNIFIVHTEYHVFLTIGIICNYYKDCDNIVYWTKSKRMPELPSMYLDNTIVNQLPCNYGNKSILKDMLQYHPDKLFFFQDGNIDNMYLSYNLWKRGTVISLVQDGNKPYVIWKKRHRFLTAFLNTVKAYYVLIKQRVYFPPPVWMDIYDYGAWRFIDELWLTNPDAFINEHHKKTIQIPEFSDYSLTVSNRVFANEENEELNNIILIIGQPTINSQNWKTDVKIVEDIVKKFPNNRILYKPHPSTNPNHLKMVTDLRYDNFEIYTKKIPVELLILQLKNSIIIGRYSTAMLTENKYCKYYWTYKLFPPDILSSQIEIVNPTKHVKVIDTLDEITF